jgi:DNA-directed RNA polymerase subunit beta'
VGDSEFLIDEVVDRFRFMAQNNKLVAEGKKPASGHPLLLGITKASLSTDSTLHGSDTTAARLDRVSSPE